MNYDKIFGKIFLWYDQCYHVRAQKSLFSGSWNQTILAHHESQFICSRIQNNKKFYTIMTCTIWPCLCTRTAVSILVKISPLDKPDKQFACSLNGKDFIRNYTIWLGTICHRRFLAHYHFIHVLTLSAFCLLE